MAIIIKFSFFIFCLSCYCSFSKTRENLEPVETNKLRPQLDPIFAKKSPTVEEIINLILNNDKDENLPTILRDLMKMLQQPGERWMHRPIQLKHKRSILKALQKLEFIDPIYPANLKDIDVVLLLGCNKQTFKKRIGFYLEYVEPFISEKIPLYLLAGPRELEQFEKDNLPKKVTSETDMLYWELSQVKKTINPKRKIFIDPGFVGQGFYRGTTSSNIKSWLALELPFKKILAISSQPEIQNQKSILNYFLKTTEQNYQLQVVGPNPFETMPINRALNAFSKWLNWEYSLSQHPKFIMDKYRLIEFQ